MSQHRVVSQDEWTKHRIELLKKEKAFSKSRDALTEEIRNLPWVKIEKNYVFTGPSGKENLSDLFGKKKQLVVYHFMFGPDWKQGCPSCSFWADNFDGISAHLAQRDVSFMAISRAPFEEIEQYRNRMGWNFKWVSSFNNDFNFDFQVSNHNGDHKVEDLTYNYAKKTGGPEEMPGLSVFYKDGPDIFHTYSTYARGLDVFNGAYQLLDFVPKGRDEKGLPWSMAWVKRQDEYEKT